MKNRKTFLLLLLFLTIHLAFASKVKKHGSKGDKGGRKGAATYLLKAENGKVYLGSVRKGRKPLRTSPATLVIYGKVLTKNMSEKMDEIVISVKWSINSRDGFSRPQYSFVVSSGLANEN